MNVSQPSPVSNAAAARGGSAPPPPRLPFGRRQVLLLGLLTALGPIAVDIYLPAFVAIAEGLDTDLGHLQLSMSAYFLALSLGQLVYGPWSDRVGRRPLILMGLLVFAAGSLVCALAPNANVLIFGRFTQGIGICAIIVLNRAIARDLYQGADAAHLMSQLMLIVSVSPLLAPMAGSSIAAAGSWRLIFWLLAALSLALLAFSARQLPETRPDFGAAARLSLVQAGRRLLADPGFRRPVVVICLCQAGGLMYLTGAAPVLLSVYRLPPWAYSLVFAVNALGMIGLAQANRRLILRFGIPRLLVAGCAATLLAVLPVCLGSLAHPAPLSWMLPAFFLYFAAFGCIMGPATVLALEQHAAIAGTASALLGSLQFATGAAMTAVAASLYNGSAVPMLALQSLLAVLGVTAAVAIVRRPPPPRAELIESG